MSCYVMFISDMLKKLRHTKLRQKQQTNAGGYSTSIKNSIISWVGGSRYLFDPAPFTQLSSTHLEICT